MVVYGIGRLWLILTAGDLALGLDYRWVMAQAARIRDGGPVYVPEGLIHPGEWADLYPPSTVVLLFLPMSFLPAVVWWTVPLSILAAVVLWHRPSLVGWAAISVLFVAWPHTWTAIQLGNTIMWIAAFVALATVWRGFAVLVLLKPTLLPFTLLGVRSRGWWVGAVALGATLLVPWWDDYLRVLGNLRDFGPTYSFHDLGLVVIPVVAWVSGRHFRLRQRPDQRVIELLELVPVQRSREHREVIERHPA